MGGVVSPLPRSGLLHNVVDRVHDEIGLVEVDVVVALGRDDQAARGGQFGKLRLAAVEHVVRAQPTAQHDEGQIAQWVRGRKPNPPENGEFLSP